MKRAEGSIGVRLLECTNPVKGKWRVRWDVQEREDGTSSYMEEEFNHKPTDEEIRNIVILWYNKEVETAILEGFVYKGFSVWLSAENQYNYKAAHDLAVQTNGRNLPVTFKFGSDEHPQYYTFKETEELTDFYIQVVRHIQSKLAEGWEKKDNFNLDLYRIE